LTVIDTDISTAALVEVLIERLLSLPAAEKEYHLHMLADRLGVALEARQGDAVAHLG
jgi:hypothetical protein